MEFHDDFPMYEFRDQHGEAEGKVQRKRLWRVFWYMLLITIFELGLGYYAATKGVDKIYLMVIFISLTILKAYFIVYSFMHLGHEVKPMKWIIIGPYTAFILYLVFMCTVTEGTYAKAHRISPPDTKYETPKEGASESAEAPKEKEAEHK
ncbi:MAG TPA: cytochrome C oxidase subunit IV family protein [Bacteroidia bacterium]|jgi:cytochrome c oxidase subunit 4|nr:cytochrome C oxidase subunit IV family protein [Bacteroidia bacterium]